MPYSNAKAGPRTDLERFEVSVDLVGAFSGLDLHFAELRDDDHLDVFEAAVLEHFLLARSLIQDFLLQGLRRAEGGLCRRISGTIV